MTTMNYTPQTLFCGFIENHFLPFLKPGDQIIYYPASDSPKLILAVTEHLKLYYEFECATDGEGNCFFKILDCKTVLVS